MYIYENFLYKKMQNVNSFISKLKVFKKSIISRSIYEAEYERKGKPQASSLDVDNLDLKKKLNI